jgi:hypothetical protein
MDDVQDKSAANRSHGSTSPLQAACGCAQGSLVHGTKAPPVRTVYQGGDEPPRYTAPMHDDPLNHFRNAIPLGGIPPVWVDCKFYNPLTYLQKI